MILYQFVIGQLSLTKTVDSAFFIILLLVCRWLSAKRCRLLNTKLLPLLTGFPNLLCITLRRNIVFLRNKNSNSDYNYSTFRTSELVRTTVKAKSFDWLKLLTII
jgi:hypothetical protein